MKLIPAQRMLRLGQPSGSVSSWVRFALEDRLHPKASPPIGEVSAFGGSRSLLAPHVDSRLTSETERGLEASGVLETSTELGRHVYELVKSGALSWSIGYTVPRGGSRRKGKLTELVEIDLAEISAVPVPANEGVRTLSVKRHTPVRVVTFDVA